MATATSSSSPALETVRILLLSQVFHPTVGGIQSVSRVLAEEFLNLGHDVAVATRTPSTEPDGTSYEIVRQPSILQLLRLAQGADLVIQQHIGLRTVWCGLLARKPTVTVLHMPASNGARVQSWPALLTERLKWLVTSRTDLVAVSDFVARSLSIPAEVIPNPYDDNVFRLLPCVRPRKDLAFVGRLIPEKGLHVLLRALRKLNLAGQRRTLTVVGDGPQRPELVRLTTDYGLVAQVKFVGACQPSEVATILNANNILVVPSVWQEPFGIVALEGLACGCVVVATERGGLPEATGKCGVTVPNDDSDALAQAVAGLLRNPAQIAELRSRAPGHLLRFTRLACASAYIRLAESLQSEAK
jgi:glycosyltransferase involved in cell wall biosynthesis